MTTINTTGLNEATTIISRLTNTLLDKLGNRVGVTTKHFSNDRRDRYAKYEEEGLLSNEFIAGFLVDKEHENGKEYHCINEHGLIYIFNSTTRRLITIKAARPKQISDMYNALDIPIPAEVQAVMELAKDNEASGLNNV